MTAVTPAPTAALTTSAFLFGDRRRAAEALEQAMTAADVAGRIGGLGRLTSGARGVLVSRLAASAAEVADVNVSDVLVAGWQRYAALASAAIRTLGEPGAEELVDLAAHRVTSSHHPRLDVVVDGVEVGSVPFVLDVVVLVRALVGIIKAGRLTALEAGHVTLSVSLDGLGIRLAEREADLHLGAVLDLGSGVPLVPVPDHPPVL